MSCSAAFADTGSDQADKSALQSMKMVAENDYLALYINEETTEAAVKDKRQVRYGIPILRTGLTTDRRCYQQG